MIVFDVSGFLCPWLQWHDCVSGFRFSVSLVTVTWSCLMFRVFCVPGYSDMVVFDVSDFLCTWLRWHDYVSCFRFSVSLATVTWSCLMFQVFCVPGYNGVSLETWLTINRRRDANVSLATEKRSGKTKVYICTTMYREVRADVTAFLRKLLVWWVSADGLRGFFSSSHPSNFSQLERRK